MSHLQVLRTQTNSVICFCSKSKRQSHFHEKLSLFTKKSYYVTTYFFVKNFVFIFTPRSGYSCLWSSTYVNRKTHRHSSSRHSYYSSLWSQTYRNSKTHRQSYSPSQLLLTPFDIRRVKIRNCIDIPISSFTVFTHFLWHSYSPFHSFYPFLFILDI